MNHHGRLIAFLCAIAPMAASAAGVERELSIQLVVEGNQSWRNALQWSKSTTRQRYELTTRLRSDGRLYAENLLDPDMEKRVRIKGEYYTYQGLLQLKRENSGRLPVAGALSTEISAESLKSNPGCIPGVDCPGASPERFTAIAALQDNASAELEKFMKSYETPGGHWLYFMGYAGCPNRLQLSYQAHFAGEQAFDHDKKRLQPFAMDWTAESQGTAEEQKSLCQRYVITLNTATGEMNIENAFIPSPHGISARKTGSGIDRRDADLPPPYEVMRWTDELLHKARETGSQNATLKLTHSLDGNASVLGLFDGAAKVSLVWSFK